MFGIVLTVLIAACGAFQVPDGIGRISNTIISNGSNYFSVISATRIAGMAMQHTDTLDHWPAGAYRFILRPENGPKWATLDPLRDLSLNVIADDMVRIYFAATSTKYNTSGIGVAYSNIIYPQSEYETPNNALMVCIDEFCNFREPNIVLTEDAIILLYIFDYIGSFVNVAYLTDDGLSVRHDNGTIISPDLHWEGQTLRHPWGIEKAGFLYVFYEAEGGIGVARRDTHDHNGSFEKMLTPLVAIQKNMPPRNRLEESLVWLPNGWPMAGSS